MIEVTVLTSLHVTLTIRNHVYYVSHTGTRCCNEQAWKNLRVRVKPGTDAHQARSRRGRACQESAPRFCAEGAAGSTVTTTGQHFRASHSGKCRRKSAFEVTLPGRATVGVEIRGLQLGLSIQGLQLGLSIQGLQLGGALVRRRTTIGVALPGQAGVSKGGCK